MWNVLASNAKRQPFAASIINNGKVTLTLSDRLKQAGIKECNPEAPENSSKNNKKKKNYMKKSYSEKHINGYKKQQINGGKKKNKKLRKNHHIQNLQTSNKTETKPHQVSSKNSVNFSEDFEKNIEGSAQETLCVSLDFIKDCQQYKKKFRNPIGDSETKNNNKTQRENRASKEKSKKQISVAKETIEEVNFHKNESEEKILESSCTKEDFFSAVENENADKSEEWEKVIQNEIPKTKSKSQHFYNIISSENMAQINQSYLKSILSIVSGSENQNLKDYQRHNKTEKKAAGSIKYSDKTTAKTITRKINYSEVNKIPHQNVYEDRNSLTTLTIKNLSNNISKFEKESKLDYKENLVGNHKEPKKLNDLNKHKLYFNKTHKKAKTQHKTVDKEYIYQNFFNEEARDVTELWRREIRKESDNSLSSRSSSTVPEIENIYNQKNLGLQSYKILKKLVEEEIEKITQKPQNNSTENIKHTIADSKEMADTDTLNNKINKLLSFNKKSTSKDCNIIKEMESQNIYTKNLQEEGKLDSKIISSIKEHNLRKKYTNTVDRIKALQESQKNPNQIVENWTILKRLEQAFLALGTPNFQKANTIQYKTKDTRIKNTSQEKTNQSELMNKTKNQNNKQVSLKKETKIIVTNTQSKNDNQTEKLQINLKEKLLQNNDLPLKLPVNKCTDSLKQKMQQDSLENKKREKTCKQLQNKNDLNFLNTETAKSGIKVPAKKCQGNETKRDFSGEKKGCELTNKNSEEKCLERQRTFNVIQNQEKFSALETQNYANKKKNDTTAQTNKNSLSPAKKLNYNTDYCNETKQEAVTSLLDKQHVRHQQGSSINNQYEKKESDNLELKNLPQEILARKQNRSHLTERSVKERSILSMGGNQKAVKNINQSQQEPKEKISTRNLPTLKSETGDLVLRKAEKDLNELLQTPPKITQLCEDSFLQKENSELQKFKSKSNSKERCIAETNEKENAVILDEYSSSSSLDSHISHNKENNSSSAPLVTSKKQALWEQDIKHYQTIVKEIISHYKRLNGFLKQGGHTGNFFREPNDHALEKDSFPPYTTNNENININEYRQRIMSEYQALPIHEYKNQQLIFKNENKPRKGNLDVVNNTRTELDLDIKDYEPNVQRVLKSHLLVGTKNLEKIANDKIKFREKNSSLQEIIPTTSEKIIKSEECSQSNYKLKMFSQLSRPAVFFCPKNRHILELGKAN